MLDAGGERDGVEERWKKEVKIEGRVEVVEWGEGECTTSADIRLFLFKAILHSGTPEVVHYSEAKGI